MSVLVWLLAAAMAISGCGGGIMNGTAGIGSGGDGTAVHNAAPPGMEGYVTAIDGGRMLVVDPVPKDFSSTGGVSEFYEAIWFSGKPDHVEVGQKVQVWFDIVAESYPGQSAALKVRVMTSPKPQNADLSEAEAIREALSGQSFEWPVGIRDVSYDPDRDVWTVQVRHEGETITIEVEDRK